MIEVMGDSVLLATTRHIAVIDVNKLPPRLVPKGSRVELEAVFRSGHGPREEQALPAEIIAADTSDNLTSDLAFLLVKGVNRPPTPIDPLAKVEPTEGMWYDAGGFPFGGVLGEASARSSKADPSISMAGGQIAAWRRNDRGQILLLQFGGLTAKDSETSSKGNPSVSITKGRIVALRRDGHGQILLLEVDGSLQPGDSGGPIVDEKTGKLLGVAVAKLGAAKTIGLVVPAEQLRKTLAGRIGALDLTLKEVQQNSANLEVKAEIVDPKRVVQSVVVRVAPASARKISPNSDGTWPPLPSTTPVVLQRDPKRPSASGHVEVALSGKGATARVVLIQTARSDIRGQLIYSEPLEIELPERPGRVMVSDRMLELLETLQHKSFSMLGRLVDPEHDCQLVTDEEIYKIEIEIPGNKVRTLAPELVTRVNRKKPLHNAPMCLIEVEGDFTALVQVTGVMSPGSNLPEDLQGNNVPFTFQGAGLLLYQDEDNFVRLERTAGVTDSTFQPIHKVLFEVVKDGKRVDQSYAPVPEGPVYLLLMRRKGAWCGGQALTTLLPFQSRESSSTSFPRSRLAFRPPTSPRSPSPRRLKTSPCSTMSRSSTRSSGVPRSRAG